MGAVRIYRQEIGDKYPWHARVGGCTIRDARDCMELDGDHYYCDDYVSYAHLIESLNDSGNGYLGEYLNK